MADYNINAVTRRVVFTGSAGLGPYAFTFEILDDDDLAVYFNTTKLTKTTDYTVTINGQPAAQVYLEPGLAKSDTYNVIIGTGKQPRILIGIVIAVDMLAHQGKR